MIKKIFTLGMFAIMGVTSAMAQGEYTVQGEMSKTDFAGEIYIVDNFGRKNVDTTEVAGGKFTFKGNTETPLFAMINSREAGVLCAFILEPGNITIAQGRATGTPMNDDLSKLLANMQTVTAREQYKPIIEDLMSKHNNDILGLIAVTQFGTALDAKDLKAIVEKCGPVITENASVKASKAAWEAQAKTAPGMMFTDFEVEYNGKIQKLSDYVGKGKYVLVDFWASWCGPCKRAIPGIKEIYEKYKGDKFEVLGVATWDKPADTEKAIVDLQLPWPQIINAQRIGSDAYGVQGIPQIILFAPDGKIVARNLHGEELKAAVDKVMAE